ncbi:MAG: hypothetical protein JSV82_08610 [Planctomycetota bacterium]|nr:MAG: hypothetical protein JSV82_08610 [Planctomycetota bacterium]
MQSVFLTGVCRRNFVRIDAMDKPNGKNSDEYAKARSRYTILLRRLMIVLLSLAILYTVFIFTGRFLLHLTLEQITELTGTTFDFESIDYNLNGSVVIKKLVITPYQKQEGDDTILKAETVYARFGIASVLLLHPRLKTISVNDFTFNARYDLDAKRWNIETIKIKPPKKGTGKIPFIHLERGVLKYSKYSKGRSQTIMAIPIYATLSPAKQQRGGYSFNITTTRKPSFGRNTLSGLWQRPGRVILTGGLSLTEIPLFDRAWIINAIDAELNYNRTNTFSLKLKLIDLLGKEIPPPDTFAQQMPAFFSGTEFLKGLHKFFGRYRPTGKIDIGLEAFGNFERLNQTTLQGNVYCKDVSICDRRFPYPVEHLTGWIDLTEQGALLKNLSGKHGDVEVTIDGFSKGYGPNRQYDIQITSDNMALDGDLYNALSTKYKKFWSTFSPSGLAAIDYRFSRQSPTDKKRSLAVKVLGAEASYHRFPYPLKNLSGNLLFAHDSVTVSNVISQYDGREIILNGEVTACSTDRPISDISVEAEDVPLDPTLAAALPDRQRDFYTKLDMSGAADANIKIFTPKQSLEPTTFTADVTFNKTSLRVPVLRQEEPNGPVVVSQSPLIISDISAKTVFTPDLIRIEDSKGRYSQGLVSMTGRIWPATETEPPRYCMQLNAEETELNEDLISVLPAASAKIVTELQPAGKINLTANLNRAATKDCPDYEIFVDCLGNSINFEPFPYPLKDIIGRLIITENSVTLADIAASPAYDIAAMPNAPTMEINGQISLTQTTSPKGWFEPSAGDISLTADSFSIKGKSLTNFKTNLYYVADRQMWLTKNLIADWYDGKLAGRLELKQRPQASLQQTDYILQVGFENIDLNQFLSDRKPKDSYGTSHTTGKMSGSLNVTGQLDQNLPHIGRCRLLITDMQVGKLSPLAKLLQVLQLTEPSDYAFQRMLVDSYIKDDRLFLEKFDLSGESLAFKGTGYLDLQSRDVDLTLTARGDRLATAEPSVLQSLTDALGTAVVRLEVTGSVYDPHVETKTLPVFQDSLQILGTRR